MFFFLCSFFNYELCHRPGALAIAVANPTDLVKVRLQAEGRLPPGVPKRYLRALDAYHTIVRQVSFFVILYVSYIFFPYIHLFSICTYCH